MLICLSSKVLDGCTSPFALDVSNNLSSSDSRSCDSWLSDMVSEVPQFGELFIDLLEIFLACLLE